MSIIYGIKSINSVFPDINGNINVGGSGESVIDISKIVLDDRISDYELVVGSLYRISGCNSGLYGGTTLILEAVASNKLAVSGHGIFYNPRYSQIDDGFGIYDIYADYESGDITIWGGKKWAATSNIITGISPINDLELNLTHWSPVAYNSTDYSEVVDIITYDYVNDIITSREDRCGNIVRHERDSYSGYSTLIKYFQWGNNFDTNASRGLFGNVVNGLFNCINSKASVISNNIFEYDSFSDDNIFEVNSYFTGNVIGVDCYFGNNTFLYGASFSYNNFAQDCNFGYNSISNNALFYNNNFEQYSVIQGNTLDPNSNINNNSFSQNTEFNGNMLSQGCSIANNNVGEGCSIKYNLFSQNSSISYNILYQYSTIASNVISNGASINFNVLEQSSGIFQNYLNSLSNITYNQLSLISSFSTNNIATSSYFHENILTKYTELRYKTIVNNVQKISFINYVNHTNETLSNLYGNIFHGDIPEVTQHGTSSTTSKQITKVGSQWYEQDNIISISSDDLFTMASNSTIPVGINYRVTNFDTDLYGGTDIFVRSISSSQLDTEGVGIFYNPKYSTLNPGYDIWSKYINVTFNASSGYQGFFEVDEIVLSDTGGVGYLKCDGLVEYISGNWDSSTLITGSSSGVTMSLYGLVSTPSYSIGDIVHWGGKSWRNLNGNLGTSINKYELDSEWRVVQYNPYEYNVSYDSIKISFNVGNSTIDGRIISRKDIRGNHIEFDYSYYGSLNDAINENPIRIFQWGNEYGGSNNKVYNSIFDCINSQSTSFDNKLDNSYIINNIISLESGFYRNTLINSQISYNIINKTTISNNELYNSDIGNNRIYYNLFSDNILKGGSSIGNNYLTINGQFRSNILIGSYINQNSSFNSYIVGNILNNNSRIESNQLLGNNKSIENNNLDLSQISSNNIRGGSIINNKLENDSRISSNTIDTNSGSSTIANNVLLRANIQTNILNTYICNIDDNLLNFDTDITSNSGTYSNIRNRVLSNLPTTTGATTQIVKQNGELKEQPMSTLQQLISPSGVQVTLPIGYIDAGNSYTSASGTNVCSVNSQNIIFYDSTNPTENVSINRNVVTVNSAAYSGENNLTRIGLMYRVNNSNRLDIDLSTTYTGSRLISTIDADGKIAIVNNNAPSSSTATGVVGEIRVTSTFIYVCTATNTWVRSAVSTW